MSKQHLEQKLTILKKPNCFVVIAVILLRPNERYQELPTMENYFFLRSDSPPVHGSSDMMGGIGMELEASTSKGSSDMTISHKTGEVIVMQEEEANSKEITFSNLANCTVEIYGQPYKLYLKGITNSTLICGQVSHAVFIVDCINSSFTFACKQIQLDDSKNCEVSLHKYTIS